MAQPRMKEPRKTPMKTPTERKTSTVLKSPPSLNSSMDLGGGGAGSGAQEGEEVRQTRPMDRGSILHVS